MREMQMRFSLPVTGFAIDLKLTAVAIGTVI